MANVDAAFGFRPIHSDGAPYSGQTSRVVFLSTEDQAAFVGDPVKIQVGAADETGTPAVIVCTAGQPVFGVITSFEADPSNLETQTRLTLTKRFAHVVRVDNLEFEAHIKKMTNRKLLEFNSRQIYEVCSTVALHEQRLHDVEKKSNRIVGTAAAIGTGIGALVIAVISYFTSK